MESKRNSRSPARSSENEVDRFSELPEEIVHRILSPLDFLDLIRFGAVSKRCREFHLSVPVVYFSGYIPKKESIQKLVRLMSCFDRYLIERGDQRLQKLRIYWRSFASKSVRTHSDDHYRVTSWIHEAVRRNVEELILRFPYPMDQLFTLPSCIFRSQCLRSLSVELNGQILQGPSPSFSCNLQFLELASVKIVDEIFFKWISCCCRCIKVLRLWSVYGVENISIQSSSLESFSAMGFDDEIRSISDVTLLHISISSEKLETIDIEWLDPWYPSSSKSLKIFAPNLKTLKWGGRVRNSDLGKLMSLEHVEIFLNPLVDEYAKVDEILRSVCSAKVLVMNKEIIKALSNEGSMAVPIFTNICNLSIHCENLDTSLLPGVVSLLRATPNLNKLYVKTRGKPRCDAKTPPGCGREDWNRHDLAFIHQLKQVTIEPFHGAFEFACYILEHAENLMRMMVIVHQNEQSKKFQMMMRKCRMASPTATVNIQRSKRKHP